MEYNPYLLHRRISLFPHYFLIAMLVTNMILSSQAYIEAWYWENRYAKDSGPYDWYIKYPSFAPLISHYIPNRHHRILVVGCGNSELSEWMVDDGYEDLVNVDISSVVIEAMQKKCSDRPQMKFLKMDVLNMTEFDSRSFDVVIDKGTLDAILLGRDSKENSAMMLGEVGRVLKDKGVFVLITFGYPRSRLQLLKESQQWTITAHVIGSERPEWWDLMKPIPMGEDGSEADEILQGYPNAYFMYICTKDESLNTRTKELLQDE